MASKTNLTTQEFTDWTNRLNNALNGGFIPVFEDMEAEVKILSELLLTDSTENLDEGSLKYRLDDLTLLINECKETLSQNWNNIKKKFDARVESDNQKEKETAEKVKQKIDQFKETADKIAKYR